MLGLSRLFPKFTINFISLRKTSYAISLVMITCSLTFALFTNFNYGIDFKGGTLVELRFSEPVDIATVRAKVGQLSKGASLQNFGQHNDILAKLSDVFENSSERQIFMDKIIQDLPGNPSIRRVESIGPKVSAEAVLNAGFATLMALLFMLLYVWVRFEWHYGLCAIIALVHDSVCVFGLYSIFGMELNFTSIVAILITIGYSINDTVVIYDRLRDHAHLDIPLKKMINTAINDSLSRTLLTSLSTMISLFALFFFGGPIISTYSLPILVGVVVGTYSSIFIAAPLLFSFNAQIYRPIKPDVTNLPKELEV
ncbi:MAG: protein translocase subunit SecF [Alphaproteobacteria bacterium]|nr:protein translocase subunit SecF [Alphaproteobacteria bacterium]